MDHTSIGDAIALIAVLAASVAMLWIMERRR
jgi:hypothetical protein